MNRWDYHFDLPQELIAQSPATPRDHSRLMVIDRHSGLLHHHHFYDLPSLLKPTDVIVFNRTKVIPARLYGTKSTGGRIEILLLRHLTAARWEVISRPGLKTSHALTFSPRLHATVVDPNTIEFDLSGPEFMTEIDHIGHTPLPPYITSSEDEAILRQQYQTVYATDPGSAAAPTAGLHFTPELLHQLEAQGIELEYIVLHVGLGTFKSPTPEQIASGRLHSEVYELDTETAARLNAAKSAGRRIISIGTTTTRVLESCATPEGVVVPASGETDIFIKPPYSFKFVDGLVTNFHLPGSSLVMLVSALASPDIIKHAYEAAIQNRYRFFSFGDATLIL